MSEPGPDGNTPGVGIWVQTQTGTWHRSTGFDGYDHALACRTTLAAGDPVAAIQRDLSERPDGSLCQDCRAFWEESDA